MTGPHVQLQQSVSCKHYCAVLSCSGNHSTSLRRNQSQAIPPVLILLWNRFSSSWRVLFWFNLRTDYTEQKKIRQRRKERKDTAELNCFLLWMSKLRNSNNRWHIKCTRWVSKYKPKTSNQCPHSFILLCSSRSQSKVSSSYHCSSKLKCQYVSIFIQYATR